MPKRTSEAILARLGSAVRSALADEIVMRRVIEQGQTILLREQQTPKALAEKQRAEIEKWWPIMKAANIKGE